MPARTWPLLLLLAAACGSDVGGDDLTVLPVGGSPLRAETAARPTPPPAPTAVSPSPDPEPTGAAALTTTVVLYSDLDADVGSRMDGVVRSVLVELGDRVAAGQVLAILDDEPQVARATAAKAALELADREYTRTAELLKKGYVTPAQHDESSYRRQAADAAQRVADIELQHTRVLAPFAGVVTRRMTGLGRPVREAEPLFRVTALQPLRALARLPEAAARRIRPGMHAVLTTDGGRGIPARVARISPAVDPGSGTVEVLLDVPGPGPLRPGSSAELSITPAASR